jgi:hypothetical protein
MAKQAKTFKGSQDIHGVIGVRGASSNKFHTSRTLSNVRNETAMPTKVGKKPSSKEGSDGDKRLVLEGLKKFLYVKMLGSWLKTEVSQDGVNTSTVSEASTESTVSTTTTPSTNQAVTFGSQFVDSTNSANLIGYTSYLIASKETELNNHTTLTHTKNAFASLSNGGTMKTSSVGSTTWVPYQLVESTNPNFQYFASDSSPGAWLFIVNWEGIISGVRSRIPNTLNLSGNYLSSTSIRLTISGNTEITESVRIHWKLASAGSYGGSDYVDVAVATNNQVSNHSFTHDFTSANAGLDPVASTAYDFKVQARNTATQNTTSADSSEIEVTTPGSSAAWSNVPTDFTLSATGFGNEAGNAIGGYSTAAKTITINEGTSASNSTTVSLVKDSGSALNFGVALSTVGDPGMGGTANSGTGYDASRSVNLGTGTLYMRFRHQFRESFIGEDANISVTFANTSGSLADNTALDITMTNVGGGQ